MLKAVHWIANMGSGLEAAGRAMSKAENDLGIVSVLCDSFREETWAMAEDADVHVGHVHFPEKVRKRLHRPAKIVWVGHGTPEYTFAKSVQEGLKGGYGFGDSFMLMQHWLKAADARVTFWPRHQAIYETMLPKGVPVHVVPYGVDTRVWCPGESRGKWGGAPSVWTGENPHRGKWPLDLFLMWPWVAEHLDEAVLHASYVPRDQHRWWFPLVNANGCHFRTHLTDIKWDQYDHALGLRNVLRSVDYQIGLVEYGDSNTLSLQANACGTKTISYRGNPYSDFWVTPGDQRETAKELVGILKGNVEPRQKVPVPDITETAKAMIGIYESIA